VLDGVLLLGVFAVPMVLAFGWMCTIVLFYAGYPPQWSKVTILLVSSFNTVGNFASFFQIAAASRLDGTRERIRMLPFMFLGFLVSTFAVGRATLSRASWLRGRPLDWEKTERHREGRASSPGLS
jgi:hypothetical protein